MCNDIGKYMFMSYCLARLSFKFLTSFAVLFDFRLLMGELKCGMDGRRTTKLNCEYHIVHDFHNEKYTT